MTFSLGVIAIWKLFACKYNRPKQMKEKDKMRREYFQILSCP